VLVPLIGATGGATGGATAGAAATAGLLLVPLLVPNVTFSTTGMVAGGGGVVGAKEKDAMGASSLSRDTVDLNVGCAVIVVVVVVTVRRSMEGADVVSDNSIGVTVGGA
jgi:hypothetical protein